VLAAVTSVTACPELGDPVCGADGLTYWNECLAKLQNVQIAKKGYCEGGCALLVGLVRLGCAELRALKTQQKPGQSSSTAACAALDSFQPAAIAYQQLFLDIPYAMYMSA
jgi:hypothetical protein